MAGEAGGRRSRSEGAKSSKRPAQRAGNHGAHPNGTGQPGPGQLMLDLEFVRGLIAAVDDSGIDSLEIYRAGTRIRIAKSPPPAPVAALAAAAPVAPPAAGAQPAGTPTAASPAETPAAERSNLFEVTSPMVGTFYRAPAPEAPPYVEIGSHVSKGQTLCILEAMKLMNELESDVDGIVREILAENADPVEYGQVLFRIEPGGG